MKPLNCLFKPKSIALVGASHTEEKLGGVILKNLLGFRGKVFPVNPKYKELMGLKAYPSFSDIPEPVDLSLIIRPAPEVPHILKEHKGRAGFVVIISSGFAEVGEDELQEEVKRIGTEAGLRMLGPNCMGIYNPYKRLDTFFLSYERLRRPKKGNVALVSQSGAILSCLMSSLRDSNTGVSKAVGYGNAIDIDESDLYEYLSNDRSTDVVVSYIESVGNGRKFIEKAKILSEKKPFLILKSGKSKGGQSAAFSHTGRLAGRYEVFHSILRQFGIREAEDFDVLMDSAKALSYQRAIKGKRVCIITNGGGSGVLAADECERQGLDVAGLPKEKINRLKLLFPHFYGIGNPLDLTAQVRDEDYSNALSELNDDYDGFLLIALPNVLGITERLVSVMRLAKEKINKPMVFYMSSSSISKKLIALLEKARIPVYPSPERAVRALGALLD
ncbi:MAG: CoA-binding protein [Nitrospirae bacterium]|nr:CoA-binding protein [Nitrospirota bacterium]